MTTRAAVLVTSDRIHRGEEIDRSGAAAAEALAGAAEVIEVRVVPDEAHLIKAALVEWSDCGIDLILTVGGTGLSPRDVTPEATRQVIEREATGIGAGLLARGLESTPRAMLSCGTAGVRGKTLIVNLPGSASAVRELVPYLLQILPHALDVIRGKPEDYDT
ncbi:MAG: MogA/MoaB family molybdenum cofactor biosynthesis protein [Planctomycetes bacterium]|nr:MogA/MoaB family molybdenum cofactor biosynthesis protein [Planctomycetota bacterium]